MERRGSNTWLVALLAVAVGFLAALLIFGGDDSTNTAATVSNGTTVATGTATTTQGSTPGTTTTTQGTTTTATAPQSPVATTSSCIDLWNRPENRGDQTFLVNLASRQPVRVHVGTTSSVPPQCVVTVVGNTGDAWTFAEGGGTTFPYAPAPAQTASSELPADQRISNALEQGDGTLKAR